MIRCCEGRIAKDENLTFGDGKTKFYSEAQCSAQILVTDSQPDLTLCTTCRIEGHGKITDPFPASSRIFGPTAWFLDTWKRCGAPSRDTLKKAMEAHTKVAVAAMARKKQNTTVTKAAATATATATTTKNTNTLTIISPLQVRYYQTDQTTQLADIKEEHKLKTTIQKGKKYYKDPITGLLFDRTKDGKFIPVWAAPAAAEESTTRAMTKETSQPAS